MNVLRFFCNLRFVFAATLSVASLSTCLHFQLYTTEAMFLLSFGMIFPISFLINNGFANRNVGAASVANIGANIETILLHIDILPTGLAIRDRLRCYFDSLKAHTRELCLCTPSNRDVEYEKASKGYESRCDKGYESRCDR